MPLARVSLKEGVVPFEWKEANIPLFKKVSRSKSDNYRPVSLTSVICKLLGRLINWCTSLLGINYSIYLNMDS